MMKILFQGGPFLFTGDSLDESGAITTEEDFRAGRVSFAHYWPRGDSDGIVKRYAEEIGKRSDIDVIGRAELEPSSIGEMLEALDNMLGGDPGWFEKPS
jgi:hypothetical protein